jgi:hypothetical protein
MNNFPHVRQFALVSSFLPAHSHFFEQYFDAAVLGLKGVPQIAHGLSSWISSFSRFTTGLHSKQYVAKRQVGLKSLPQRSQSRSCFAVNSRRAAHAAKYSDRDWL